MTSMARGKNPYTGRYRRDFYGKNREDRDHSRNRRDFYGKNRQDRDYSRYRRDFFGHDLGDKRRQNASRPFNRPWRKTVGPGAPPTRRSEQLRKRREERKRKRAERRKRKAARRNRIGMGLPTNRRNQGWQNGGRVGTGLAGGRSGDGRRWPNNRPPTAREGRNVNAPFVSVWNRKMQEREARGEFDGPPQRRDFPRVPQGGRWDGRFNQGRYGGGRWDMDPIPFQVPPRKERPAHFMGPAPTERKTTGVWAGDKSKGIPGEWDHMRGTQGQRALDRQSRLDHFRRNNRGGTVTPGELPGPQMPGARWGGRRTSNPYRRPTGGSRRPTNRPRPSSRGQVSGFIDPYALARRQGYQGNKKEWLGTQAGERFQRQRDAGVMW